MSMSSILEDLEDPTAPIHKEPSYAANNNENPKSPAPDSNGYLSITDNRFVEIIAGYILYDDQATCASGNSRTMACAGLQENCKIHTCKCIEPDVIIQMVRYICNEIAELLKCKEDDMCNMGTKPNDVRFLNSGDVLKFRNLLADDTIYRIMNLPGEERGTITRSILAEVLLYQWMNEVFPGTYDPFASTIMLKCNMLTEQPVFRIIHNEYIDVENRLSVLLRAILAYAKTTRAPRHEAWDVVKDCALLLHGALMRYVVAMNNSNANNDVVQTFYKIPTNTFPYSQPYAPWGGMLGNDPRNNGRPVPPPNGNLWGGNPYIGYADAQRQTQRQEVTKPQVEVNGFSI